MTYYDDDEEEEDVEEGEVNFFRNMPWINENIGSMMEAQLTRPTAPNQCRQCRKLMSEEKPVQERFCSDECKHEWNHLLQVRIDQGKHDLRVRGFD